MTLIDSKPASVTASFRNSHRKPLVYSCSGCSSAAQMANDLAVRLDREEVAEMSCIAGVGGDVPSLVKIATSGREIIAIDGCPLHCVVHCLARHGISPAVHIDLTQYGVKKRYHQDYDPDEAEQVWRNIWAKVSGRDSVGCDKNQINFH